MKNFLKAVFLNVSSLLLNIYYLELYVAPKGHVWNLGSLPEEPIGEGCFCLEHLDLNSSLTPEGLGIVCTTEKQWTCQHWSVEKADLQGQGFEECFLSLPFLYSPLLSGGNLCSIMSFLLWGIAWLQSTRDRTKSPETQSSKTVNQIHLSFVSLSYLSQWWKKNDAAYLTSLPAIISYF